MAQGKRLTMGIAWLGLLAAMLSAQAGNFDAWSCNTKITINYRDYYALTNFPLLVKLGPNIPGFSYSQFGHADGSDLRFADGAGAELEYEIDKWDTNGTSLVWVEVPILKGNGTTNWFDGQMIWVTPWEGKPCSLQLHNGISWASWERNDGVTEFVRASDVQSSGFPYRDMWNIAGWNKEAYPNPASANWVNTNNPNPTVIYNVGDVVGYREATAELVYCRSYNGIKYLEMNGSFVNVLNLGFTMDVAPHSGTKFPIQNLMQFCDYDPTTTNDPYFHTPVNTNVALPAIYAYWGNAAASRPAYTTNGNAWSGGFAGVWHMNETNVVDSRKRGAVTGPGTPHSVSLTSGGQIGSAVSLNSALQSYIDIGTFGFNATGNVSYAIEAWISRTGSGTGSDPSICYGSGTGLKVAGLGMSAGKYMSMHGGGSYDKAFNYTPASGQWQHVVMLHYRNMVESWNSDTYTDQLWINGHLVSGVANNNTLYPSGDASSMLALDAAAPLMFGKTAWDSSYVGTELIDEVRMNNTARSQPWIRSSYLTVASNTLFETYGTVSNSSGVSNPAPVAVSNWTAYNDAMWDGANESYNNTYSTNSPKTGLNGPLMTTNGEILTAAVSFNTASAVTLASVTVPSVALPPGTDAYNLFNGKVGLNNVADWASGFVTMSLTGLDTSKQYTVALFCSRLSDSPSYTDRWTVVTLSGADAYVNNSSAGAVKLTTSAANDTTRLSSALAQGLVARYDGVRPGSDGAVSFSLTGTGTNGQSHGYLNAFMVQELSGTGTVVVVSTNTTPGSFVWKQGLITGTMNASACTLYLYTSNSTAPIYIDDVSMCAGSTAESGANLVVNPGFESGTNGWETVGSFAGSSLPVSSPKRSGSASLLLQASTPVTSGGSSQSVKQGVTGMTSGSVYTLSFWYYATNAVDFVARYSAHPAMTVPGSVGASGTVGTNQSGSVGFDSIAGQFVPASNVFHLGWGTQVGKAYRIMRCTSMGATWQQYAVRTAAVSSLSVDIPLSGQSGYFRVLEMAQTPPTVDNASGASSISMNTATLNGNVGSTGLAPTTVYVCWDTSDKGTSTTGAWAHVDSIGVRAAGSFADPISGLTSNTTYYYRCFASNFAGSAFASSAASFTTVGQAVALPKAFYQLSVYSAEHFIQYADTLDANKFADAQYGSCANYASTYVCVSDPVVGNNAPTVNAISANPSSVAALGNVTLSVNATDADGDPLQYFWVAPAGQVGWSRASNETWKAASVGATYQIQVMVGDGKSWTSRYVNVQVTGNGFDDANANHPVAITSVKAAKTMVTPGETIGLSFTSFDRDPPTNGYSYVDGGWVASGGKVNGLVNAIGTNGITWTAPSTVITSTNRPTKPGYVMWPRLGSNTCPIPLSTGLVGVALVGRVSHAHTADTFMPCWAADGSMYSAFQDGHLYAQPFTFSSLQAQGWGGDPIHNGWVKIRGDDPMDLAVTDAGILAANKGSWQGRYPNAVFHKDGVLYFGTRLSDNGGTFYPAGPNVGFHSRPDGGSWTMSPFDQNSYLFGNSDPATGSNKVTRLGQTYLVDYGKNQQYSPDGKVYFVSAGTPVANGNTPHEVADDAVYLCRVTASQANINNSAAYEVWTGSGWSSTISAAQPIVTWSNHVSSAAITYNPGLNKYIMSCENAKFYGYDRIVWGPGPNDWYDQMVLKDFDFYFLESDSLTGPWKMVQYMQSFGIQGYYPNIPSKFLSADGKSAWLWYGANFQPREQFTDPNGAGYNTQDPMGAGYRMVEQEIRFLTPAEVSAAP